MQHDDQPSLPNQLQHYLQEHHGARSAAYFVSAAALFEAVGYLQKSPPALEVVNLHLRTLPLGAALTYGFARLRPADRARWNRVPLRRGLRQGLLGAGLGAAAFLAWLGIARAKGWASAPEWGWRAVPLDEVLRSAALLGVGHLAVAWNEEQVFRGYGFEVVREALGQSKAIAVLIPGFALYHGLDPQQLIGMLAGGTTLLLLRLQSDGLWLPVGYHYAWNVLQTAACGPAEGLPSLRPLKVHGPARWMGRPGAPEPGLLSTLVHLAMAIMVWLWGRAVKQSSE